MENIILWCIIGGIAGILLFAEIICWLFKINKIVKEQKETNRLLRKIAGESEPESKTLKKFFSNTNE